MYRTVPSRAQGFHAFLPASRFAVAWLHSRLCFLPKTALALACLAAVIVLLEFVSTDNSLIPFFQADFTQCVCREKGRWFAKRRIILSGHIDAAYEMRYNLIDREPAGRCRVMYRDTHLHALLERRALIPGIAHWLRAARRHFVAIFRFALFPHAFWAILHTVLGGGAGPTII